MADGVTYRTERRSRRGLIVFLLGLLLGAALGWYVTQMLNESSNTATTRNNNSNSNNAKQAERQSGLVPREQEPSLQTRLTQYSQLLIEAARENVDAPSGEATAAKASLETATTNLTEAMGLSSNSPLRNDFTNLNNEVLEYAAAVKTGGETNNVEGAVDQLVTTLKSEYRVTNNASFDGTVTSLKNTINESVRNFANQEYQGSYEKQLKAEAEIHKLFSLLQKK